MKAKYKKIIEDNKTIIILTLLFIIIMLQTYQVIKLNAFCLRNDFRGKFVRKLDGNNGNISGTKIVVDDYSFFERTIKKNGVFIISINAPETLKKEDVKLLLSDNKKDLNIDFIVKYNNKTINFSKVYTLPKNNATIDLLKYDVQRGRLEILIPITK
jgi:hypothetical protein